MILFITPSSELSISANSIFQESLKYILPHMKVSVADLSSHKNNHKELVRWANLIEHFDYS